MQEETNEKTIALYIKTGKLTAQQLQKAMKALLAQMKKQHDKQKIPHGKQTLKQLMKQNADALTAAFKEFSAKKLTQEQKPSIRKLIVSLKEKAAALNAQREKVKNKDRGIAR